MLGEFIGEIIIEGLLGSIWHAIKAGIGFVYLYLRYWQPQRVRQQLAGHYGNRYATAGAAVLTGLMQGLGVMLLIAWLGVVITLLGSVVLGLWR